MEPTQNGTGTATATGAPAGGTPTGTPAAGAPGAGTPAPTGTVLDRVRQAANPTGAPAGDGGEPTIDPFEVAGFDRRDIEKITDPTARQYVENLSKSLQTGLQKKFREAAEAKKKAEQEAAAARTWTPDRVQQVMNDPTFQASAASVIQMRSGSAGDEKGGLSDEEWSTLSESEKQEIAQLKSQTSAALRMVSDLRTQQEDTDLRQRYASYNPDKVNEIRTQLLTGRLQATREHLWKVLDYEDAVKRAYDLGRQDERGGVRNAVGAITTPGGGATITSPDEPPAKAKGENTVDYFRRLAQNRLAQFKRGK